MSRQTKDEIQTKLEQEVYRANMAVVDLAKIRGGVQALINLIENGDIKDLDDAADVLGALLDADPIQIIQTKLHGDPV